MVVENMQIAMNAFLLYLTVFGFATGGFVAFIIGLARKSRYAVIHFIGIVICAMIAAIAITLMHLNLIDFVDAVKMMR